MQVRDYGRTSDTLQASRNQALRADRRIFDTRPKKKDGLQAVITPLKSKYFDFAVQFVNYR